jgi:hypothetical protein
MDIDLEAPDHTTLSRRGQCLDVGLNRDASRRPIHLIVDSTGLSIVGEGEWAAVKHGGCGKRAWKKLHLGVDRSGSIVAEVLTNGNADDPNTALDLLNEIENDLASFTADAAYDTIAVYEAAARREDVRAVIELGHSVRLKFVESPEVAALYNRGMSDPAALSPDDTLRFRMLLFSVFENIRLMYEQYQTGAKSEQELRPHLGWLGSMLKAPGGKQVWQDFETPELRDQLAEAVRQLTI